MYTQMNVKCEAQELIYILFCY